ncbi:ABC transporter substrate-binding protein [Anaerocolumna cellulosilytica]|uniref:ABC transporter substrate-binding protein n=1 Tax=Anaerocolumna cellulosilytica TaxID=433286 RepID=A0A6S6QYY8_9FIRM|nr:ABC transporter substrate-binding protein [Anaerocolumna cellulosilytica]MBB5194758.1 peptide/nickel transport system substrate-binding protein [Anaerocolumna cellulosilytica]BCJ94279.1 ABC transporter substrate-binding protein [Anaerocolumna cellulosilytica]
MKKRWISLALASLFVITALTACAKTNNTGSTNNTGGTTTQPAGQTDTGNASGEGKEKILRLGNISSPTGKFNPLYANDDYTAYINNLIFQSLVTVDANANLQPGLAEKWEVSEDSKTITFHLFQNIKWTDGEPFTAEDVQFTLEFMSDKNYTGLNSTYVQQIVGFDEVHNQTAEHLSGINVIDEYTIAITTKEVYASFYEKIGRGVGIIAKHVWEGVPLAEVEQRTELLQNPIGTGPFKLQEYKADQYTTLVKNPDYYEGTPKIDKIIIQVVNPDTAQAQLLNNELDMIRVESLNPDDIKIYEDAGFEVKSNLLNAYQHMVINFNDPILSNKDFRQAMAYAINREGIVASLLYGYGNVANTIYTKEFFAYPGDDAINDYAYNPEKAIEILSTKAGYEYKDGTLYKDGNPVKLTLIYPSGNKAREGAATVIQQNFKEIGIDLKLELVEFATLTSILQERKDDNFQLALLGNGFGADADVAQNVGTGGSNNHSQYSNTKVDELLVEGLTSLDNDTRAPIYKEIATILNDELPVIYLYNWERFTIVNPKVKNVNVTTYSFYEGVETWDIVE